MLLLLVGSPAYSSSISVDIVGTTVSIYTSNKTFEYDIKELQDKGLSPEAIVALILERYKNETKNFLHK